MKKRLAALFLLLLIGPGFLFGGSIAIEHLRTLDDVRIIVRAPVYEPIPGYGRKELENNIEKIVSGILRDGGLAVCEHASAVFRVDIKYVESSDEIIVLVHAQLYEKAQLLRTWSEENEPVWVTTWQKVLLVSAIPEKIGDKLAYISDVLATMFVQLTKAERATNSAE